LSANRVFPAAVCATTCTRRIPLATRTLNRRALRDQNDAAEAISEDEEPEDDGDESDETPAPKVTKARARKTTDSTKKKPAKPRAPRKKAVKIPPRMFARWAVCDNGMKRVAVFEYKDRAAADAKLAQIRESKSGTFFLLLVKDPYVPPAEPAALA
jgi:hypothetical protein